MCIRDSICFVGALDRRLNVQKVRLAGCHRAPPRSWTLLIALRGFLRQAPGVVRSDPAGPEPRVRDVMAAVAATATPGTSVGEAHRLLREHGIHHLPVLDGDLLVGIVSQRDLLRAESDALPIRVTMARMVFVLSPEPPLSCATGSFRERRLPVLLVVEGRALAGVLRAADVLETAWD